MECEFCGGNMREEIVTYTGKAKTTVIVIKNVKAYKCSQCGAEMYDDSEVALMGKVSKKIKDDPFELVMTDADKWR